MIERDLLPPKTLRELLRYERETGKLFWRSRPLEMFATERAGKTWNTKWAGKEAFKIDDGKGYRRSEIFGIIYKSHRVIWAIETGEWPVEIDHESGVRSDNRFVNLRDVSRSENGKNRARQINNTSGVTGVSWDRSRSKWWAEIKVDGKVIRLGRFGNLTEAASARKTAEIKYGFHQNHGRAPV